ncbi:hypothetical protein GDO86_006067 [Hymenochirus boettgeri]|uniref:Uncharacterized protein n=1 Tax=Hymenochirus boettgeri TaxID=247094 RepID=A0A8T2J4J0_9PIPI|nr:hypothetical protein GDO86_006067 [Hymenochirus boettgeri]
MRTLTAVLLSCISLLCVQHLPCVLPLPFSSLLLPAPREPPDIEKHQKEVPLPKSPFLVPSLAETKVNLQKKSKRRIHRSHASRLMRVGCSLGTCQVQNLNHRLWQLMGRFEKEDSPIQLSNPHSYG